MTQIEIIKALSDNYIYVLHNPINKQTAVIDPGEAQPVIDLLEKKIGVYRIYLILTIITTT